MVAERFISRKLKFQGNVAAVAIAVSFFVIIVAVAVTSGFRNSIRQGVAAMTGDIRISPLGGPDSEPAPMPRHIPGEDEILALPGVKEIVPAVVRAGIVKNGEIVHGVVVKGIQRADSSLSVSIPRRLSEITGLGAGDPITVYFVGEKIRVRKFTVSGIHRDVLELDDNLLVYANLEDMQRLNGWSSDQVSCLDILTGERNPEGLVPAIGNYAGDYYVSSSRKSYPQVFEWLNLLDFNVLIILALMTVVAGFNMVSGLLIMLLRNISTIGTLKSLGMTDRSIAKVFLKVASVIVLKGMAIGNAAALLLCALQSSTHLLRLNPENYFVSFVPVHVNIHMVVFADVISFVVIMLLLLIPCVFISRVDPAQTVRAQ